MPAGKERQTNRVIHQNLAIAVVTVVILLAGVLMKEVNMAGGMLAHEASTARKPSA